jgi:hypothetical protein
MPLHLTFARQQRDGLVSIRCRLGTGEFFNLMLQFNLTKQEKSG